MFPLPDSIKGYLLNPLYSLLTSQPSPTTTISSSPIPQPITPPSPPPKPTPLWLIGYPRNHNRRTHRSLPLRWALYLQKSPARGTFHRLWGAPGTFRYDGPEINKSVGNAKRAIRLGFVDIDGERAVERFCREVAIRGVADKEGRKWTEAEWTLEVIERVKGMGWCEKAWTEARVREVMRYEGLKGKSIIVLEDEARIDEGLEEKCAGDYGVFSGQ